MEQELTQDRIDTAPEASRKEYVVFKNKGLIDLRAITTFGISAKDPANENPIGYFGTGLKYALAVLVREGIEVSILSGLNEFKFTAKKEFIRGKEFSYVCLNGEPMNFTIDLGKNWELWQAFRELYSNCIDEFGKTEKETSYPEGLEGITQVIVKSQKFVEIFENRHEIFLQGDPLIETAQARIHGGTSNSIFYRGIKIASFKDQLMYRYNIIKHMDLTEDRTIKYSWQINDTIVDSVLTSNDEKYIESILTAPKHCHEHSLNFLDNRVTQSETFRKVAGELRRRQPEKMNRSSLEVFEREMKHQDRFSPYKPTHNDQIALTRAIDFLAAIGFVIDKFPLVFVETLGESTLAVAEDGKIVLSSRLFHMGTKQIASTLLEEYVHNQHGYHDLTRALQTFLFDNIITLGEKITGEVL